MPLPRRKLPPISFRDRDVEPELARRAIGGLSAGQVAARDLARYYDLLSREAQRLDLSTTEVTAIRAATDGTIYGSAAAPYLAGQVREALDNGLAARYGIDGAWLLAKLRALTPSQAVTLVDTLEREAAAPERETAPAPTET